MNNWNKALCYIGLATLLFLAGGCSGGFETVTIYDSETGETKKIDYASTYISGITNICDGLDLKITGYNTKKINPITYPIMRALGALGPDDMEFTMSFVVHFRNSSDHPYNLKLTSVELSSDQTKKITPESYVLAPDSTFSTEEFFGEYSKWAKDYNKITVHLDLIANEESYNAIPVVLNRETIEDMKKRRNKS